MLRGVRKAVELEAEAAELEQEAEAMTKRGLDHLAESGIAKAKALHAAADELARGAGLPPEWRQYLPLDDPSAETGPGTFHFHTDTGLELKVVVGLFNCIAHPRHNCDAIWVYYADHSDGYVLFRVYPCGPCKCPNRRTPCIYPPGGFTDSFESAYNWLQHRSTEDYTPDSSADFIEELEDVLNNPENSSD